MKKDNLPVYNAVVDVMDEKSGTNKISFVKNPANKSVSLLFKDQVKKAAVKLSNEGDKRLATALVMSPDIPIYRSDENLGEFYVNYPAKTIELMRDKYMFMKKTDLFDVEHSKDVEGVYMVETGIVDSTRGMAAPDGLMDAEGKALADGSWWATFRVLNDEVWNGLKSGELTGVSLDGVFDLYETEISSDNADVEKKKEEKMKNEEKKKISLSIFDTDKSKFERLTAIRQLENIK